MLSWCQQTITCRAAIAWKTGSTLAIEEVQVDPPKAREVRIKVNLSLLTFTFVGKCKEILFHEMKHILYVIHITFAFGVCPLLLVK